QHRQEPARRRHRIKGPFWRNSRENGMLSRRLRRSWPVRLRSDAQRSRISTRPIRPEAAVVWWKRDGRGTDRQVDADPGLPLIRLDGVTKIFRGDADEETRALDGVTLDIDRGEYVSVSGPSGCGKSTLLSILGLLDAPTAGRYWFSGRPMDRATLSE